MNARELRLETIEELTQAVDATTNVHSITYDPSTGKWTVRYRNGLESDTVDTIELVEFIENA